MKSTSRAGSYAFLVFGGPLLCASFADGASVPLQNATATFTQGGFAPSQTIDGLSPTNDAGGVGWAIAGSGPDGTAPQTIVWQTQTDLFDPTGENLQFSVFAGGFGSHTVGHYRISYTTADRSTFGDGAANVGTPAQWTPLSPAAAYSSGNAAYRFLNDNSILMAKQNPNLATDRVLARTGPLGAPITGFRFEALEDPSLPNSGPGRSTNGNIVVREVSVDTVAASAIPNTVVLQSATAQVSQGGFEITNAVDGQFSTANAGGAGWANNGTDAGNVATFETQQTIGGGPNTNLTFQLFAGGFGTHTLGKFRISATTADRSLFADGNLNGGASVGTETDGGNSIWTVLDPSTITSDSAGTTFSEDGATHIVLASGAAEFETYTLTVPTGLWNITGFRLEAFTDPTLGAGHGPGYGSNGNFVLREFTVAANSVPEPSSAVALLAIGFAAFRRR